MYYVAETDSLVADGVIDAGQADEIKARARSMMIALCVNTLLILGIIAATLGLVFYLASALSVAICGAVFLAGGLWILRYSQPLYRMFGNASAMIGAGMLISGTGLELAGKMPNAAGLLMGVIGASIALFCLWRYNAALPHLRFAYGATLLMGLSLHIVGIYFASNHFEVSGWQMPFINLYVFAAIVACGMFLDIRLITALAIVPFAQALNTGTYYFSAVYAFYSPEPTLSILQMGLLIAACLWAAHKWGGPVARQAGILMIMAFIVASLSFLVGSLFGDVVGEKMWGPSFPPYDSNREAYEAAREAYQAESKAFHASTITIHEHVYSIIWAVTLAALIFWAAMNNRRGLFNVGMTFAAIHAYTQMFESFYDEPLTYVIGGLAAIPLAFGLWRLNNAWFYDGFGRAP